MRRPLGRRYRATYLVSRLPAWGSYRIVMELFMLYTGNVTTGNGQVCMGIVIPTCAPMSATDHCKAHGLQAYNELAQTA